MENKKEYKPVQSIERLFQVLEVLALNPEGLSLLALSEKTGLPSSTVHRLLHTLYALGYTEWRSNNSSPYKLTLRLFEYGSHSLEDRPFIQAVHPYLDKLSAELSTSIYLYLPDHHDVLAAIKAGTYSAKEEPTVGARLPMYCCSAGKSILAFSTEEELSQMWAASHIIPYTPNTVQSLDALRDSLSRDRNNGYSLSKEEYSIGLYSLSVPLMSPYGTPFGAITATFTPQQFQSHTLERWLSPMKQYAGSIQALYVAGL